MEKTKKRITAQGLEKISEAMLTAFLGCDFGMLQRRINQNGSCGDRMNL